jgi:hypothetical protein
MFLLVSLLNGKNRGYLYQYSTEALLLINISYFSLTKRLPISAERAAKYR